MQRDAKISPEDQMPTQAGPIDEVQALKSIFYTFFNTSQKSQKQQKDVLVSMSEHETSLNPFHIFDKDEDDQLEDAYQSNSTVFIDNRNETSARKHANVQAKKGSGSHRALDATGNVIVEETYLLDPVEEELGEEDYDVSGMNEDADIVDSQEGDETMDRFVMQKPNEFRSASMYSEA